MHGEGHRLAHFCASIDGIHKLDFSRALLLWSIYFTTRNIWRSCSRAPWASRRRWPVDEGELRGPLLRHDRVMVWGRGDIATPSPSRVINPDHDEAAADDRRIGTVNALASAHAAPFSLRIREPTHSWVVLSPSRTLALANHAMPPSLTSPPNA